MADDVTINYETNAITVEITGSVVAGAMNGTLGNVDNRVPRSDGVGGATFQASLLSVDDSGSTNIPAGQSYKVGGVDLLAAHKADLANPHAVTYTQAGADPTGSAAAAQSAAQSFATGAVSDHNSAVAPHTGKFDASGAASSAVSSHESSYAHGNIPSSDEKAALVGTSGTPSTSNKYVTNADARNTNARTPSAHEGTHEANGSDPIPWTTVHGRGNTAGKPSAALTNAGYLYFDTQLLKIYRSNGSTWDDYSPTSAAGDVTGPAGAVAGNFAALDATGKILSDSGVNPTTVANKADKSGTSDIEVTAAAAGFILKDRTTGKRYRLLINNGILGKEELA